MPLYLRRKTSKQPQSSIVLDLSNPLSKGLVVWVDARSTWVPASGSKSINNSLVGGSARGFVTPAINSSVFTPNPVSGSEWSTFGEVISPSISGYQAIWSFDNSSGNSLGIGVSAFASGNFGVDLRPYAPDSNSSQAFATNTPIMCGVTVSVSASKINAYYNGKISYSPTLSSSASTSYDRVSLFAKRNGLDAAVNNSRINWVALWNRALSANEVARLYNNPWQVFAPSSLTYLSLGAAPPASTIYEFQTFGRGVGRGIARGIA